MAPTRKLLLGLDALPEEAMKPHAESFGRLFLHEKLRDLLRLFDEIGRFFWPGPGGGFKRWWADLGLTTNVALITGITMMLLFLVGLCCCCCCRGGGGGGGGEKLRRGGSSSDGRGGGKTGRLKMTRVFIGNEAVDFFRIRLRSKKDLLC